MKVFLSHSSMHKTNVKAIVSYLPKQIQTWLDENNLVWGSNLEETFESVIKTEIDYVLVFLSDSRQSNVWVLKELKWALEHEKKLGRNFVLPIIMPSIIGDPYEEYPEITGIKYIKLDNYEETGFKSCAEKITTQLFSLIINDLENMHKPKQVKLGKTLLDANNFIEELCKKIYSIVFKHRAQNPMFVDELYEELNKSLPNQLSKEEFPSLLTQVCGILSGIYYDGYQIYVIEEHSQWKKNIGTENKRAIAYAASRHITNGQTVFIDAGSTMLQLVEIVCKRLESRTLSGLKLVVISTEHASKIADACAGLGYDQYSSPVVLYVPGGMVRLNTKAMVGYDSISDIERIVQKLGKFDVAFVGANGATCRDGIFTHINEELAIKQAVIANSKNVFYTFDDSKCGLVLESKLADFSDDNIKVIINDNPNNVDLQEIVETYGNKIELAKPMART
ncbi:MAG: TIR domain-containing protein [Christensenellales bacterium]